MVPSSPRHLTRRTNLKAALAQVGGPTKLAQLIGKPKLKGHLSNVAAGKRGLGDELAAAIERAAELPTGWMDQHHSPAGVALNMAGVAHPASYPMQSDALPLLTWETIMRTEVPEIFRATLPDDSLAPDFPAGTEIVWTTRRRAAPGRLILVKDRHGQLHARQCHQGRAPGQWLAAPINPAFVTFSSTEDGLQLVAVYKGRLEPDD